MKSLYQGDNCGLFIGFTSSPSGEKADDLCNQVEQLFTSYKETTWSFCQNDSAKYNEAPHNDYFYNPETYFLFGTYDVAFISLCDSFDFSARAFHASSDLIDSEFPIPFAWQSLNGSGFYFEKKKHLGLEKKWETIFGEKREKKLPLLSITTLKFNFGLLTGNGSSLTRPVMTKIIELLEEHKVQNEGKFDFMLIETTSWHEYALIVFSNSYEKSLEIVLKIRELELSEIGIGKTEIQKIIKNSLSKELAQNTSSIENAHVFDNTNTTFGYHKDAYTSFMRNGKISDNFIETEDSNLNFFMNFDLKPGHIKSFADNFFPEEKDIHLLVGRGDVMHKPAVHGRLEDYLKELKVILEQKEVVKHLRKLITRVNIRRGRNDIDLETVKETHPYIQDQLGLKFSFSKKDIIEVKDSLIQLRLSKIMRDRVLHLYEHYNNCIQDPLQASFFIELRPFLTRLKYEVANYGETQLSKLDIQYILEKKIEYFDAARRNRLSHGFLMSDLNDTNIDFHGSAGQLLTAFDGTYKQMCKLLGEDGEILYRSFVYIGGDEGVDSNIYSLRTNFFHLYQPEGFVQVAIHEASNWFLERIVETAETEDNDLLYRLYKKGQESESIRYLTVDTLTLHLAYSGNWKLFFFWHWSFFMQHANFYTENGKIDEEQLYYYSSRLAMLLYTATGKTHIWNEDERNQYLPTEEVRPYWDSICDKIKVMLSTFEDKKNLIQDYSTDLNLTDAISYLSSIVKEEFAPNSEQYHLKLLQLRLKEVESIYQEFKNNPSYDFFKNEKKTTATTSIFKINVINYCFLRYVMEYFFPKKGDASINKFEVLPRNKDGKPDLEKIKNSATEVYFDPQGGLFTTSHQARKELFYHRTMLTKTLWDLSTKNKKDIFLKFGN